MNDNKKVTVIVPVYRVEDYLRRCLDSIINNTYRDLEILCVNDGSPDNCLEILKEYEKADSRIIIIDKENGGLSSARNAGIANSTGDYIVFIDSDDWVHPQYIEMLVESIQSDNTDAVICGFKQTDLFDNNYVDYKETGYKKDRWVIDVDDLFHKKTYQMFKVYVCGVLYKRQNINATFPDGIKVIEDNIFNILNLPVLSTITILNVPIYYYYINSQSIMHTYSCEDSFAGLKWCCAYLRENNMLNRNVILEVVDFIYKRMLFYRYVFTLLEPDNEEVIRSVNECYQILKSFDSVLGMRKRIVYRVCVFFPRIYYTFKRIKDGDNDIHRVFSLAEGKLIVN